jgi:hypothetical protein
MKTIIFSFLLATTTSICIHAEEIDFTSRKITDPQLVISSSCSFIPEKDEKSALGATRDENYIIPVYRYLWREKNVIMLEPFSREKAAQIDFSAITKNNKGILRLKARNHPSGDFELQIFKNGELFKKESIGANKWERFTIPFDHDEVIVKNNANGWCCEFGFFQYSFSKQ